MDPNNIYPHTCIQYVQNNYYPDKSQELSMQRNRNAENQETVSERAHTLLAASGQNSSKKPKLPGNVCDKVDAVNVQSADVQLCEQIQGKSDYYPIKDFERKGCALILSNDFKDEIKKRQLLGYKEDKENLRKLCEGLGCNPVDVRTNKKAKEIKNIILDFADKIKDCNPSFIMVFILSHGGKQNGKHVFNGINDEPVEVDFVLDSFNNEKAPHLQNIPKLFIFQFCRGETADHGIRAAGHRPGTSAASDTDQPTTLWPFYFDQFVAYPTHDDYISWVEPTGSWFINAITNIFMTYAKDEHVADLFTMVNKAVKNKTWGPNEGKRACKEMSVSVSSLTEKLYLYPGYRPASSN